MKSALYIVGSLLVLVSYCVPALASADTQVLIIRHGEKPAAGLGQLSCKGLNRALALPDTILKRYGKPDLILAPNPAVQKADRGVPYAYIRPLATVEPLAIQVGLPVDIALAFNDLPGLEGRLNQALDASESQLVVVAWEHKIAEQIVRNLAEHHQLKFAVPHWEDDDFDSIYILSQNAKGVISFRVEKQGLDKLSEQCPKR